MTKFLPLFISLLFANVCWASGNNLTCSYYFDGKAHPLAYERDGDRLVEKSLKRKNAVFSILLENNDILIFGMPVYNADIAAYGYQTTILSKKTNEFVTRILDEPFEEKKDLNPVVYGECF